MLLSGQSMNKVICDIDEYVISVLGIALATAAIDIMKSSVSVYRENIKKGDIIKVEGEIGKIEKRGLIYTTIRTPRNEEIDIPNKILASRITKKLYREKIRGEKPYKTSFQRTFPIEFHLEL